MRFVILVMLVFIGTSCSAQMKNHIYYDLPKTVTGQIKEHIEHYISKDSSTCFVADLSQNSNNQYLLSIVDYKSENGSKVFGLLYSEVIKKSNRMLRVGDYEIPIMISEDMVFADLGETKMPDGRVAKKRVLMTFDGYTIAFDRSGKIYEN